MSQVQVSVVGVGGEKIVEPIKFNSPLEVSEAEKYVRQQGGNSNTSFKLMLGDRILNSNDKLDGEELLLTMVTQAKLVFSDEERNKHLQEMSGIGGIGGNCYFDDFLDHYSISYEYRGNPKGCPLTHDPPKPCPLQDPAIMCGNIIRLQNPCSRNDKDVMLNACSKDGSCLKHASPQLKSDKDVVLAAVATGGYNIRHADESFRGIEEVVFAAVSQDGTALQYATPELTDNKVIVLAAVSQNGASLQYASPRLACEQDVVIEAVRQYGGSLKYAGQPLQNNAEILKNVAPLPEGLEPQHARATRNQCTTM